MLLLILSLIFFIGIVVLLLHSRNKEYFSKQKKSETEKSIEQSINYCNYILSKLDIHTKIKRI